MRCSIRHNALALVCVLCGCSQATKEVEVDCAGLTLNGRITATVVPGPQSRLHVAGSDLTSVQIQSASVSSPDVAILANITCAPQAVVAVTALGDVELRIDDLALVKVSALGSSRVVVRAPRSTALTLSASGQGRLRAQDIVTERLALQSGGHSAMAVAGQTDRLDVEVAGEAQLDAAQLRAQHAAVRASGPSRVRVWATAHLSHEIDDEVDFDYSGSPDVSRR